MKAPVDIPQCSVSSIPELYGFKEASCHIPAYPKGNLGNPPYHYNRSDEYIAAQASRFGLIGGEGMTTLVPKEVFCLTQDFRKNRSSKESYWSGYYSEHFGKQNVEKYHWPKGFQSHINERIGQTILTPYPYADIPQERSYLKDDSVIPFLNDKGNMYELSKHYVVPYMKCSSNEFQSGDWEEKYCTQYGIDTEDLFPLVVKLTEPSGGGDGVRICHSRKDLDSSRRDFQGKDIKIEAFVDIVHNYNIQLQVTKDGEIFFLGASIQKVGDDGKYGGNYMSFSFIPDESLWNIAREIAENAYKTGWYGVAGLDIVEDKKGDYLFLDPNFRLNGSTPFYLMQDKISAHVNDPYFETGFFTYPGSPDQLFSDVRSQIEKGVLLPVGCYYPDKKKAETTIYAAVIGDDIEKIPHIIRSQLQRKNLLQGIAL